jgi:hypothetical protein
MVVGDACIEGERGIEWIFMECGNLVSEEVCMVDSLLYRYRVAGLK